MRSPYSIRQVTGNYLAGLLNLSRRPMSQEALFTNIGIARARDVHIPYQTIEATPRIEIHENRHSCQTPRRVMRALRVLQRQVRSYRFVSGACQFL